MSLSRIKPYLEKFRLHYRRVVLTGGEPAIHPELLGFVEALSTLSFDIGIDTSSPELLDSKVLELLSFIHVSLPLLGNASDKFCCGNLDSKIQTMQDIQTRFPMLRITFNIPVSHKERELFDYKQKLVLENLLAFKADVKFIREFEKKDASGLTWSEFWGPIIKNYSWVLSEADPREVVYLGPHGTRFKLSEIPCWMTDSRYLDFPCSACSDLTVNAKHQIKVCRWRKGGVPIEDYDKQDLTDILARVVTKDWQSCTRSISSSATKPSELVALPKPHLKWGTMYNSESLANINLLLSAAETSYFGNYGLVAAFERKFCTILRIKYSIAVASGTAALFLAYLSFEIGSGDEVIVPSYSYPGTVTPLLQLGATVIFCDSDPLTGNMCPHSLSKTISYSTKLVVVTHMWGNPAPIEHIASICNQFGVPFVEDCSHSFGAELKGQMVGSFGRISCFSLQGSKVLPAGEGGIVCTNDSDHYEKMTLLSSLRDRVVDCVRSSERLKYWETGTGFKFKIHPFAAAYAFPYLTNINEILKRRKKLAELFSRELSLYTKDCKMLPSNPDCTKRVYYGNKLVLSNNAIESKHEIIQELIEKGLEVHIPDLRPLHLTNLFYSDTGGPFPGATSFCDSIISIPSFTTEDDELIRFYASTIGAAIQTHLSKKRLISLG